MRRDPPELKAAKQAHRKAQRRLQNARREYMIASGILRTVDLEAKAAQGVLNYELARAEEMEGRDG